MSDDDGHTHAGHPLTIASNGVITRWCPDDDCNALYFATTEETP